MSKEEMIVVIQCAGGKHPSAGHMITENKEHVMFVADPQNSPKSGSIVYKRPDDPAHSGLSWRELLIQYNEKYKRDSVNPLRLLPAWKLYKPKSYLELVDAFGVQNVFILSAGWGLIPADFLTPNYDITFSNNAEKYKRRKKKEYYYDFAMLKKDIRKPVVFLGGKSYIQLFCYLTKDIKSERIVFYNLEVPPEAPGCSLRRFETRAKTNWHYGCAKKLAGGNIDIF